MCRPKSQDCSLSKTADRGPGHLRFGSEIDRVEEAENVRAQGKDSESERTRLEKTVQETGKMPRSTKKAQKCGENATKKNTHKQHFRGNIPGFSGDFVYVLFSP